jgi:D-alanyl-D-alanine carboxypeptidase
MFKSGWILFVLVMLLSVAVVSCQTVVSEPASPSDETTLAPSPAETTDGSLVGDGWKYGQTPQSYNTGDNQVPASEEEVQRVTDELQNLGDNQTVEDNLLNEVESEPAESGE